LTVTQSIFKRPDRGQLEKRKLLVENDHYEESKGCVGANDTFRKRTLGDIK